MPSEINLFQVREVVTAMMCLLGGASYSVSMALEQRSEMLHDLHQGGYVVDG